MGSVAPAFPNKDAFSAVSQGRLAGALFLKSGLWLLPGRFVMISPVPGCRAASRRDSTHPAQFSYPPLCARHTFCAVPSENTTLATMIAYTRREHPVGR